MVIGNADAVGGAHPSGIPQDKIDNIMSGIANTGTVKMNNHRKKLRQRFDIIKKLGQGTYGKVQLGINKETGQEVAIKTIKKCKIEAEADLVRIRREVQIMSSVQHPNIIHIYEVFENREKMVLVMEFAAGGELYDYLSERKVLSEEEARRIFRQVATAVYYCHKHKICHRDLKLENILLDEHGNAKIADFGLSNVFDDQRLLATFCGSPLYASPEIVEGTPYQGPEVDCWSLGVLLYTLVYGSMPFDGSNFKRLVKQISQGDYYEPKKPSRASALIRDMLTVCPRKRATIEQICSHWWVNENDNRSCLDLAEDLANQTPVRLDVLLSLTPAAITADQLVVPSADGTAPGKGGDRVPRSHSVGSIRDMGVNTEAERRILDMVAAGGEAALMPSPTRTITPAQSPVQSKRKLENTVSTENAAGLLKKKEKAGSSSFVTDDPRTAIPLNEEDEETPMETEEEEPLPASFSQRDMQNVGDLCTQLIQDKSSNNVSIEKNPTSSETTTSVQQQKSIGKLDSVEEAPEEKDATRVIKKFVNKHKTTDLVNAIHKAMPEPKSQKAESVAADQTTNKTPAKLASQFVRKCSLQDETPLATFNAERGKSRILETAEKFHQMNSAASGNAEKPKKFVIPGVSVGSFKKEFERKASMPSVPTQGPTTAERRALEQVAAAATAAEATVETPAKAVSGIESNSNPAETQSLSQSNSIEGSDSKNSLTNISLEEARRSMENSIALLRQAQHESSKEVDQLCAKTENIEVRNPAERERERKLKNARAIIGNAIQPVIRRPLASPPPTPSLVGIGGGGLTSMNARPAGGGVVGFTGSGGGGVCGLSSANTSLPSPTTTTNFQQPHTNVALAAARQNIMGRLAAVGTDALFKRNSFSYSYSPQPQQHHQKQHHHSQQQLHRTEQKQQQHYLRSHQPKAQHNNSNHNNNNQHILSINSTLAAAASANASSYASASAPTTPTPAVTATATAIAAINNSPKPFYNSSASSAASLLKSSPGGDPNSGTVKTSTAQITLKSATLPRRKTAKTEIQLDIKPRIVEQSPMRFTTEMQHPVADLRSAPARDGPLPYSPPITAAGMNARATSLEPKEHIIPIQRPQVVYTRSGSNATTKSGGSLSRQSTADSESDTTTTNFSQSTVTGSSQPIKKSPREFIIPIAVEGGGFITPREGSIEPSESSHTTSSKSTFSRLRPTRRIGSLLNDSGVDEGLPFHKMRTAAINREGGGDDDSPFTLHKLRSSRPVKKISQDNDSQSSGEEDDDDGFEILTAENLFSTLLQRVRALTNRLNVNNDITSGFPNSSRLLNNLRQGQSSFWNQEPFGRSQFSYTYSETVEKKQVRLSNARGAGSNIGTPWRHSMSRDLGSDMDSMFSRTGATLPRGNKSSKGQRKPTDGPNISVDSAAGMTHDDSSGKLVEQSSIDEPLDLADLDLSRLRLSKKDLETLSSITPGLPKCFQEQLLAKLPPTQARKLSRTLSMQNSPQAATVRVYKRSQSGGRGLKPEPATVPISTDPKEKIGNEAASTHQSSSAASTKTSDENSERSSNLIYQRSLSRHRYDCDAIPPPPNAETSTKGRSNSVCPDENNKSLCSSYSSDISDKYKYYSPYLSKSTKDTSTESGSISPLKRYGSVSPRESCHSPNAVGAAAALGRPPSGCLSPPPIAADGGTSSLRRRSSQRRISRFLRPDFFEEPAEDNPYQREKKLRERETQSVLREIREKSRESSRDRLSSYECDEILRRKHSLPNEEATENVKSPARHVRNKSMEMHLERRAGISSSSSQDPSKSHRQSLSRSRELSAPVDKSELADKILQELQILSAVKSQHDHRFSAPAEDSQARKPESAGGEAAQTDDNEKTATIRKVKKPKLVKEKITESPVDTDPKCTTTVIRKVKKIIKKTDTPKVALVEEPQSSTVEAEKPKPESKLKRPKSYPTKDPPPAQLVGSNQKPENTVTALPSKLPMKSFAITENGAELTSCVQSKSTGAGLTAAEHRENRLVRPKSYPASKLTPPKITRSGIALPSCTEDTTPSAAKSSSNSRQSTSDEKSTTVTPSGKSSIDSSSSSESRPTAIKKVVKVTKKSKLAQPIALTAAVSSSVEESKEPVLKDLKEKSPEKKVNKGLLYAIGQKFEKLRDSAMSKDKKSSSTSSTNAPATNTSGAKQASPGKSSPEKLKEKSKVLKKKKSMEGNTSQTDKDLSTPNNDGSTRIAGPAVISNDPAKPKTDKRSRIDAMIRSLRERSVPRSQPTTETHFITRAVSVEEMPGTFNRNAVNKVLGLFKRFEKDGNERKVRNTRSTSNIERQIHGSPASPIYQNVREHPRSGGLQTSPPPMAIKTKASSNKLLTSKNMKERDSVCDCEKNIPPAAPPTKFTCNECFRDQSSTAIMQRHDEPKTHDIIPSSRHEQAQTQNNKDKRKALMLDLVKLEKLDNNSSMCSRSKPYLNGNGIYSNLPPYPGAVNNFSQHNDNTAVNNNNNSTANNNNQSAHSYRTSSAHEINRNHLFTPSCENIANYSSDSRSYQDDCASTSTFMSPTDEPELYFDNWSVCSEDNYILATPSPTVSRLSRTSQLSSPTRGGDASDPNESVIDRIKRRSFYCRFNEKKPKRTSSIVGPAAVRDYYREQQAAVKARSNSNIKPNVPSHERAPSPDITQQFLRPLKLSPLGTELKPPIYKSPHDYAASTTPKPRKSLNDIRPTTSPSFLSRRYGFTSMNSNDGDYLALTSSAVPTRIKTSSGSSSHESNGGYYNTYNPKRRSSYNLNGGVLQSGTNVSSPHNIDGYATVGRRTTRPYDQRTMSLLEPPSASSALTGYRREPRTVLRDYSTSISRSNAHYRTPTTTRSPSNI